MILRDKARRAYQAATHSGAVKPLSFLLTWWRHFDVPALTGRKYWLVQQRIDCPKPLAGDCWYWVALARLAPTPTRHGALWHYRLTVQAESVVVATADTLIYVKEDFDAIHAS